MSFEELRGAVAQLADELAELRAQLASEVRTRRLVVVDAQGVERVRTALTPTASTFEVLSPPRDGEDVNRPGAAQLVATFGECADDAGRSVGTADVGVWARGEPGADLTAIEATSTGPGRGGGVRASLDLYRPDGRPGVCVSHGGLDVRGAP